MDELIRGGYEGNAYPTQAMDAKVGMPTLKQRLAQSVKDAESRLADAKRASEILEKNPDLEELLNIMQKGRF
jgi:hypothetical protein